MVTELPPLPTNVKAARLPNWSLNDLQSRNCPTCQLGEYEAFVKRPDGLLVAKCKRCGMNYLPEVPSEADLERFYEGYGQFKGYSALRLGALRLAWRAFSNPYISIIEDSGGLHNQSLCEIGCSFGQFLQLARQRGAKAFGVEIDRKACEAVRGLGVPCETDLAKHGTPFQIICCFQLLEHLKNPASMIRSIAESLVPDGRILISIPNGGEATKLGHNWVGFRVDLEHINYFDISTLSTLLKPFGLYVEQYWEHMQPGLVRDTAGCGAVSRLQKSASALRTALKRLMGSSTFDDGSFVLTVLARKVSS